MAHKFFYIYCFTIAMVITVGSIFAAKGSLIPLIITAPIAGYFVWTLLEGILHKSFPDSPHMSMKSVILSTGVLGVLIIVSLLRMSGQL